jgi:hypothetical protein
LIQSPFKEDFEEDADIEMFANQVDKMRLGEQHEGDREVSCLRCIEQEQLEGEAEQRRCQDQEMQRSVSNRVRYTYNALWSVK